MTQPAESAKAPILVAVDFSPGSEAAMQWAVDAAVDLGAPLRVLHVVHDPADAPGYYRNVPQGRIEALEEAAGDMLVEFVDAARSNLPRMSDLLDFESSVVVGLPVTRILEIAERLGARMIVMGGQGRTRLSDRILGSKVERVARLASTPVTIVKQSPDEAATP